jgi:hypothetical protein
MTASLNKAHKYIQKVLLYNQPRTSGSGSDKLRIRKDKEKPTNTVTVKVNWHTFPDIDPPPPSNCHPKNPSFLRAIPPNSDILPKFCLEPFYQNFHIFFSPHSQSDYCHWTPSSSFFKFRIEQLIKSLREHPMWCSNGPSFFTPT